MLDGSLLGNGWYRGRLGLTAAARSTATELGVIAQLEIAFADGHRQLVATDESWTAGPSRRDRRRPVRRRRPSTPGSLGELVAARRFAGDGWAGVRALGLRHQPPGARTSDRRWTRQEELRPVQDLDLAVGPDAGRLRAEPGRLAAVHACRARRVPRSRIRHAEVLEHDELGVRPLRSAQATDRFILSGGEDIFEPTMTFHGFRYAEVDGWPGELDARTTSTPSWSHSDLRRTGHVRVLRPAAQPAAPATSSGAPRATSSTSRPTARSATSGWAGPVTSPCSRRPRRTSSTSTAFLADWLRRPRRSSRRTPTAWCRSSCPTC